MSAPTSYTSLEPSFTSSLGLPSADFQAGQAVSFISSTSFIFSFLMVACIAATGFVYVKGGLLRIQASEAGIRKSNEEWKRGTLGLLGVLSLFLILYTVNRGMLRGDISLSALRIAPTNNPSTGQPSTDQPTSGTPPIRTSQPSPSDSAWARAIQDDPTIRAQIQSLSNSNGGVNVNKSVCPTPSDTSCTTVGGLPPETISMLSQLRNTCPGSISITGGTEAGHTSHGPGMVPVDISLNDPQLASCIRKFTSGPQLTWCNSTYVNFGYTFCDEKNTDAHWHVFK